VSAPDDLVNAFGRPYADALAEWVALQHYTIAMEESIEGPDTATPTAVALLDLGDRDDGGVRRVMIRLCPPELPCFFSCFSRSSGARSFGSIPEAP